MGEVTEGHIRKGMVLKLPDLPSVAADWAAGLLYRAYLDRPEDQVDSAFYAAVEQRLRDGDERAIQFSMAAIRKLT